MRFSVLKSVVLVGMILAAILAVAGQYPCTIDPSRPVNGGFYKVGDDVQAPVALATPDPQYPESFIPSGLHKTRLWVVLDCTGIPALVKVYSPVSTGLDKDSVELGNKAREEVLRWKFGPAVRRGQPIMVQFDVEFTFVLDRASTSTNARRGSVTHLIIYTPLTSSSGTTVTK